MYIKIKQNIGRHARPRRASAASSDHVDADTGLVEPSEAHAGASCAEPSQPGLTKPAWVACARDTCVCRVCGPPLIWDPEPPPNRTFPHTFLTRIRHGLTWIENRCYSHVNGPVVVTPVSMITAVVWHWHLLARPKGVHIVQCHPDYSGNTGQGLLLRLTPSGSDQGLEGHRANLHTTLSDLEPLQSHISVKSCSPGGHVWGSGAVWF